MDKERLKKLALPIGAGLVVLFLFLRSRGGGNGVAAGEQVSEEERIARSLQIQSAQRKARDEEALSNLNRKAAELQFGLFEQQTKAQQLVLKEHAELYDSLANGKPYSGGWRCPDGKPRLDPTNPGAIFCRTQTHKGGLGGFLFGGPQGPGLFSGPGGQKGWGWDWFTASKGVPTS